MYKSALTIVQRKLDTSREWLRSKIATAKKVTKRWYAKQWWRIYSIYDTLSSWKARHGNSLIVIFVILLITTSSVLAPTLQRKIEPYFLTLDSFDSLKTLLVTLGAALVGATAIAFSLVMFAMQVNVERIPHGLFRKFSSDWKLLSAFALTFVFAIVITASSLIPDKSWVARAVLIAFWGTALILILFVYAYRRALRLISPTEQLALIIVDTQRDLKAHVRRAQCAEPLLEHSHQQVLGSQQLESTHDLTRLAYFQHNPQWMNVAKRGILYAISFARRYAEQGDHEVSRSALSAVVVINAAYVETKGKTFFASGIMIDNPLATDPFINDSLEHLRQTVQIGVSTGDEQLIEQTFEALAELCRIYMDIDYALAHASQEHALIAAEYLSRPLSL